MDWFSEPMLALYGTVFGGVGLKVVESVLGKAGKKTDDATTLRAELRQEITALREESQKLKNEAHKLDQAADEWRMKYFSLLSAVATQDQSGIRRHLER